MYVVGEGIHKEPTRTCSIICNYVNIMHIYINHCYIYTYAPAMHKCENKINHPIVTITTEARIPRYIIVSLTKQNNTHYKHVKMT